MEDKSFDLLTKMYSEITERLNQIDQKLDKKSDKTDIVRIENDLKPKVELALEGYQAVSEKITTLEGKIDNLTSKIVSQDVQITILTGGKQSAN